MGEFTRRCVIGVVALALLGGACGGGGKTATPPTQAPASGSSGTAASGGATATPAGSAKVLATLPLATAKAPNVRVEINDLRRTSDGVVTLTFTLVNDGTGTVEREYAFSNSEDYNSFNLLYLLDEAGQKKYLTLQDSNKDCVCSRNLADNDQGIAPGTRAQYFAKFPAPPDAVTSVQVVFPQAVPVKIPIAK